MEQITSKLKEYWEKLKALLKKVPKKILVLIALAIVIIVGVIVFVQLSQPYSVLFTGLNSDEAAAVMAQLEEQGAKDYRLENNDTILVPKSQENILKARLLMEGYPQSGFSYSTYYDHVGSLATESERSTAYLLLLQERMGAVIRCFDGVKDAAVTITPGEKATYVLDNSERSGTSAAVFVTMRSGQLLSDQQAEAIRTLVANAVQGLKIDFVSISDSAGNLYSVGNSNATSTDASQLKLYLEEKYNNIIRTNVMQVLTPLFGENNVRVSVTCNVDVNKTIQDKTEVFLPEDSTNGEGIIGSKVYEDYIVRGGDSPEGGVVGAGPNSDLNTYIEDEMNPDGDEKTIKTSGQVDYDNSRDETHIERVAGYLSDCMVSVSINSTTAGQLTQTSLDNLSYHVARAAGISDDMVENKISLYSSPFYEEPTPALVPGLTLNWLLIYAAAGAVGLLLLILILVLIFSRRRKRKRKEIAVYGQPEDTVELPIPEPAGADVMSLQTEKNMELRKDIRKFADDNPEIAAQMLRTMLRGGETDG